MAKLFRYKCPNKKCESNNVIVLSVKVYDLFKHRYRKCLNCGTTWQTTETNLNNTITECNYEEEQKELPFYKNVKNLTK